MNSNKNKQINFDAISNYLITDIEKEEMIFKKITFIELIINEFNIEKDIIILINSLIKDNETFYKVLLQYVYKIDKEKTIKLFDILHIPETIVYESRYKMIYIYLIIFFLSLIIMGIIVYNIDRIGFNYIGFNQ